MNQKINYIFIDTECFDNEQRNLNSRRYEVLKAFCKSGNARLVMPEIIRLEYESHISDALIESIQQISTGSKKVTDLTGRKSDLSGLKIDQEALERQALKALIDYLAECNAKVLPLIDCDLSVVVGNYFNRLPPFSKKKKNEFPDAIAANCLAKFAKEESTKILVASSDPDWKGICDLNSTVFIYYPDFDALLQELLLEKGGHVIDFINKIQINRENLMSKLEDELMEQSNSDRATYFSGLLENNRSILEIDKIKVSRLSAISAPSVNKGLISFEATMKFKTLLISTLDDHLIYDERDIKRVSPKNGTRVNMAGYSHIKGTAELLFVEENNFKINNITPDVDIHLQLGPNPNLSRKSFESKKISEILSE